jgi:hypothetical protein
MSEPVSNAPETHASGQVRVSRARSVPTARPFLVAVGWWALHFLGLLGALTAFGCLVANPSHLALRVFLASLAFGLVTWLIAFFKRRAAFCPLCKGTPLMNSGALPHMRAWRIRPLNHGVSAVLSILATQTFRCMYCGSDYDLLKPSSRLHGHDHETGAHRRRD